MTRIERIIFLSLVGFLLLGVGVRIWRQANQRINWQVERTKNFENPDKNFFPSANSFPELQGVAKKFHRKKSGAKKLKTLTQKFSLEDPPLDLNRACQEDLERLPSIGKVTAARILSYRREHGKFQQKSDLLQVPGFRLSTYKKIEPYIEVSPAP